MVEKYEQMVAQDPTSTVFVELARAYLERGDNDKAIALCQQGCVHHPNSVVGRVLWGKGLINVGRAAEAMKQFDLATSIDKDNAHAYNLIGEVLLRKGLYRSALPILRKAAQLQPNDGRITQWLEQTRQALSGGPAPVLYDTTTVDPRGHELHTGLPLEGSSPPMDYGDEQPTTIGRGGAPIPSLGVMTQGSSDEDLTSEKTVIMQAYVPEQEREKAIAGHTEHSVTTEFPTAASHILFSATPSGSLSMPYDGSIGPPVPLIEHEARSMPQLNDGLTAEPFAGPPATGELPVVVGQVEDDRKSQDPFGGMAPVGESGETVRGLTSTFDALSHGASPLPPRSSAPRPSSPSSAGAPPMLFPVGDPQAAPTAAPVNASSQTPAAPAPRAGSGPLLEDIVSAQSEIPTAETRQGFTAPNVMGNISGFGGLLDEIPDEAAVSSELPRAEYSQQATEAIAKEYERELRVKLEATTKKKTFLQKHGRTVLLVSLLVVVVGAFAGSAILTRQQNQGLTLDSAIGKGKAEVNADTKEQYTAAVATLNQAVTMDKDSPEAWGWLAYANAMLYAEHGGTEANRNTALQAIGRPSVRTAVPELAAVVDFLTADAAGITGARQQLLGSTIEKSAVFTQAAKVLLDDKKLDEAFKKLDRAVDLDPKNVRALVLLGEYYLTSSDYEHASQVLSGTAEQFSKFHPMRVLGLAEARLELSHDVPEALSDLDGLNGNATIPPGQEARYALLLGRAKSANGKHEDALKTLIAGMARHPDRAFDFQSALGLAYRNAGQMDKAQKAFEDALRLDPKNEEAKEGFGRVLIARSREKELLEKLKPESEAKRVSLVRGIAYARQGDFKKARLEFDKTTTNGKYPAEAAMYLALADASEEQGDKSIQLLEKLAGQTKRYKATVQLALARIYMQRNQLDKARAQLEEASKDPQDYEANTQLAELLINIGLPKEALEPLTRAVERNGSHAPARHLLSRLYTAMGQYPNALKQVEAWTLDNPALDLAWKDAAFVYLHVGRLKEAADAIARGVKGDSEDIDGWRLRAQILFARGDAKNAFAALERANKLNSKDADTFCEIGNAYVRQANNDVALKAYEAARREDPKSFCGRAGPYHARPALKGGKPRDELTALIKSTTNSWDKGFAQASLARVLVAENDLKNALPMAQEATQTTPASAQAWFALGEVSRVMKNQPKALEAYAKAVEMDASWSTARLAYADSLLRAGGDSLPKALHEYEAVVTLSQNDGDVARARKTVLALKKQLK